jgi:hypothetical protein
MYACKDGSANQSIEFTVDLPSRSYTKWAITSKRVRFSKCFIPFIMLRTIGTWTQNPKVATITLIIVSIHSWHSKTSLFVFQSIRRQHGKIHVPAVSVSMNARTPITNSILVRLKKNFLRGWNQKSRSFISFYETIELYCNLLIIWNKFRFTNFIHTIYLIVNTDIEGCRCEGVSVGAPHPPVILLEENQIFIEKRYNLRYREILSNLRKWKRFDRWR